MATQSCKAQTVHALTPKNEQIFIDRLIEILIMQVEPNENEHANKYKRNTRVHNVI